MTDLQRRIAIRDVRITKAALSMLEELILTLFHGNTKDEDQI
jgi:hypothetical protein